MGTCTDQSWANEACPWLLSLSLVSQSSFSLLISRHVLDKSTAALNFDHFKYSLNTTSCLDNTICPGPQNQSCCDAKNGKKEIDFGNNAIIPTQMKDLSSYYEAAGYTIPSRTAESSTSGSTAQSTPSSSITTVSTSTSVSRPSSMPSNGRDQPSGGSGLSTSAKAIVGAAASIVALLLLVSCLYLIRRHRLKHREKYPARNTEPEGTQNSQVVEVRRDLSELQGSPAGVEMDDTTIRKCGELAADRGQG